MSDAMKIVETASEHGPALAATGALAVVATKVFGPALDEVGSQLRNVVRQRFESLQRTGEKQEAIAAEHGKNLDGTQAHLRVVQRVLNDATLYDDDVQQTYVAGLLAGSRNDDGSDDRPVYYLSVIDRLTALQLAVFHTTYAVAAQVAREQGLKEGLVFRSVVFDVGEFVRKFVIVAPHWRGRQLDLSPSFVALEHERLIDSLSVDAAGNSVSLRPTRIGALLYDWAHGFSDENLAAFAHRSRPDIGIPELHFDSPVVLD